MYIYIFIYRPKINFHLSRKLRLGISRKLCIISSNPMNVLRACLKALKSQNSPKIIARIRGKKIAEITKMKH